MSDEKHETGLEKAMREADEAEARLRAMKESLMPRDRATAVRELLVAELRALTAREGAKCEERIAAATTDEERSQILRDFQSDMLAGIERVQAEMREQIKAWTIARIEDRERDGL